VTIGFISAIYFLFLFFPFFLKKELSFKNPFLKIILNVYVSWDVYFKPLPSGFAPKNQIYSREIFNAVSCHEKSINFRESFFSCVLRRIYDSQTY